MCRLGWDVAFNTALPDFNEEPFFLGAYDQIANYRGGRGGRAKSFKIGWEMEIAPQTLPIETNGKPLKTRYVATFEQVGSQPICTERSVVYGNNKLTATFGPNGESLSIKIATQGKHVLLSSDDLETFSFQGTRISSFDWEYLLHIIRISAYRTAEKHRKVPQDIQNTINEFLMIISTRPSSNMRPYATAPVRTKPERTYNPIDSLPKAEGSHVPMLLAKTFIEGKEKWGQLKKILDDFGAASGLFNSLVVRPLGKKESDPFQINVKISGPAINLIDVGYGVSQALPIVVDALQGTKGRTFLFQQPEVHLHPKGQAALGTFLARFSKLHHKRFIIETHSDHMIDRVRIEIRDKTKDIINHEDVLILFFDRQENEVVIHEIRIDEEGDLVDVPSSYRQFFLAEERRVLGI